MKLFNALFLSSILALSLSACLKDKNAEEVPATEQTMEETTETIEVEEAPADSGTTQSN